MLEKTSQDFRNFFLLEFTKSLIKNSMQKEFFIEEDLEKEVKEVTPFLVKKIPQKIMVKEIRSPLVPRLIRRPLLKRHIPLVRRGLHIIEPQLPPNLQYLQPIPTNSDLDLGKLNSLIRDPAVKIIECDGEDEKIIVRGDMGIKPTVIILSKDEIEEIIEKFSVTTKIPTHEGVFKVVAGRLILTAIISDVISSKFIIKKMVLPIGKFFENQIR